MNKVMRVEKGGRTRSYSKMKGLDPSHDDEYFGTGKKKGGIGGQETKAETLAKLKARKQRSRKFWKLNNSPEWLRLNGEEASAALTRHHGREPLRSLIGHRPHLTGTLNPENAAKERRDWINDCSSRHREFRRQAREAGLRTKTIFRGLDPGGVRAPNRPPT